MAPHKGTRLASSNTKSVSFHARGAEGENVERIICTPRYITLQELRKPAVVTDRLRRDYADLAVFDRTSMKCGVRKILTTTQVVNAVNAYWGEEQSPKNAATGFTANEDDSLVSMT